MSDPTSVLGLALYLMSKQWGKLLFFSGLGFFGLFRLFGLIDFFRFLFVRLLVLVDRTGFFEVAKRRIGCAHDQEIA